MSKNWNSRIITLDNVTKNPDQPLVTKYKSAIYMYDSPFTLKNKTSKFLEEYNAWNRGPIQTNTMQKYWPIFHYRGWLTVTLEDYYFECQKAKTIKYSQCFTFKTYQPDINTYL